MRDFLIEHPNVKIALNFHAWGPLFITPYNWDGRAQNFEVSQEAKMFYDEVFKHAGVPNGYIEGNGHQTIGYTANGEASDWMLHELGIFALSPELGINNSKTDDFFIRDKKALQMLIKDNYIWVEHTMRLLFEKIHCSVIES